MSTTARQRPWDQYEKSIGEFLRECGSITMPMNQRNYLWKSSNIEEFLNDMEVFLKGDMRMCFGNVIQFVDKHEKEIWDGQQRIITSVLVRRCFFPNSFFFRVIISDLGVSDRHSGSWSQTLVFVTAVV